MKWFFLSFRDSDKNLNLGCCNVQVEDHQIDIDAIQKTHDLGINPGGEVMVFSTEEIEPGWEENKLYSKQELDNMAYKKINQK